MVMHSILHAKVRHRRLTPKQNYFCYKTFYTCLNMTSLDKVKSNLLFGINRRGLMSFFDKDHGARDGSSSLNWAQAIFEKNQIKASEIMLVTMPRVFGYVFNPISFWLAYHEGSLRGVIAEVNNTFKETHSYICTPKHHVAIQSKDWFQANKVFHVSPFFEREGEYHFNFQVTSKKSRIIIHYYVDNKPALVTSIDGKHKPMSKTQLISCLCSIPFLSLKVITLIHLQALKLYLKKIPYRKKPLAISRKLSEAIPQNKISGH